ncbi:MAG: type pilus assembly protein PilB [Frankiaceae bacterium]|nr:type pilus assembly protein PilB [Frankiaceae bacterium]
MSAAAEQPLAAGSALGKRLLGEILVEHGQVTPQQLAEALLQQRVSGKRLGALLVELGALDERVLADALGEHFALPVVDLRHTEPDPAAIARIPESSARSLNVLPLALEAGRIVVAVADPLPTLHTELQQITKLPVAMVIAAATDIRRAIDRHYRALARIEEYVEAFQRNFIPRQNAGGISAVADDAAPVVQVVNLVVVQALRDRASDVHIEPMGETLRVRFRIDGVMHDVLALPSLMGSAVISRIKVLAGMNIVERRRPQDGQLAMTVDGRDIDIRVATAGTIQGEKVVLRLLDKTKPLFRISELGMPADTYHIYSQLVRSPFGMVICAGPTGSGKTTSLYATMSELNQSARNIMTIEDPVEYVFPSINQIQINEQAGITFAGGLKAILRQDPDIVLVGEIRDEETARTAVQAALTGHFVLSSLHATDATAALLRFVDMGIEPFLITSSVVAVVSQRLVRMICQQCRKAYSPDEDEMAFYYEAGGRYPEGGFWHGSGCTFCAGTGYSDRTGVYELLRLTPEMRKLLVSHPTHDEVRALAMSQGMRTLRQEAIALVAAGGTTVAEVVRSIYTL